MAVSVSYSFCLSVYFSVHQMCWLSLVAAEFCSVNDVARYSSLHVCRMILTARMLPRQLMWTRSSISDCSANRAQSKQLSLCCRSVFAMAGGEFNVEGRAYPTSMHNKVPLHSTVPVLH